MTDPESPLSPDRRRAILIATCTALMAVVASASGLNVAQQGLASDLGASQAEVLWIINAYVVTLGALLLPLGALADRWGRKPMLVGGLVVFGLANVAAALVDTVGLMIAARVVAGVGAAMVMPVTLSVITSSFAAEARTQAIGIWSAVAGGGGLLGMIISAVLVDVASWQWLFAFPVLLVVVSFAITVGAVPNSREAARAPFDGVGSVLSVLGIGGVVLGLHEGPVQGWLAPVTLAGLLGGALALTAFIPYELRRADPLLDIRAFRDRRLANGSTALLVVFAVSAGIFVVLFPFFEAVLGWSALGAMLGLVPMIAVMMGTSGLAAPIAKRLRDRTTMLLGIATTAAALGLMAALVSVEHGYLSALPGMLVIGLGMGLTMPLATEAITSSLPADRQGLASALNDTTREVGSAIGIALLGAVLTASYRSAIDSAVAGLPGGEVAREGIGQAISFTERSDDGHPLVDAARHAFVDGWATSMWVGAAAVAALLIYLVVRGAPQPAPMSAPAS